MNHPARSTFRTSDGVELSWLESGDGPALLMLPGWSQSAAMFKEQFAGLSDRFDCLALDHRGHGESGRPAYGYRISRLAQDVREFIQHRGLDEITLLGHSMGASVMWGYWDLYGSDRLARMVIDDEPSVLTLKDTESAESAVDAGEIFPWSTLIETCDSLVSPDPIGFTRTMIENMLSDQLKPKVHEWILAENLKLPRAHAATLLFNHSLQDWRDLIPRIDLPTLIITGRKSVVPWRSQAWIHSVIPGSKLEIFDEKRGGHHFAFLENPAGFNELVADFMLER